VVYTKSRDKAIDIIGFCYIAIDKKLIIEDFFVDIVEDTIDMLIR